MEKISIFIGLSILFLSFSSVADENPRVNADDLGSELNQLKDSFQKMEEDYKARINAMEGEIKDLKELYIRETELEQIKPFYGVKGSLVNPDVSIIADTFYHFSDQSDGVGEFKDDELFFREIELAVQGYIYPGVRAEFFPVWEVEEGKVEIEESFANFLTLPLNSSLLAGRQRVRFGLVNPIHQHFREYVDVPLAVQNFLGAEGYIDDGIDISVIIPRIIIPVKVGFGAFDGDKSLAEEDDEEEGDEMGDEDASEIFESKPVEFKDHVFLAKLNTNIPLSNYLDISLGYHVLRDNNGSGSTSIHNGQFSFKYQFLNSYYKLLWQNELYVADIDDREVNSMGLYSLLKFTVSRFLDAGIRYDWSELGDNDDIHQWAINPILTWRLTEASYIRVQYRYTELEGISSVNEGLVQFVWGLGPHAHALKE